MLVAEVQACIEAHAMLFPGAKVLVAVSGGADSTALLFVLFRLRSLYNLTLAVAHVNYQLRGEESERDARFVAQQAAHLAIPLYQIRVDVQALQQGSKMSLQQAARQLRYRYFHTLSQALGVSRVALGHTADDQAETLLMRLLRGSGPGGLAGMPAVRLPFVRPLIAVSRHTIQSYLQSENLLWVEDSSNASPRHLRNRVRLDLLPKLRQYNPQIVRHLNELSVMLRAEHQLLEQQVDEWAAHICYWPARHRVELRSAPFATAPIALQRRLLRRLIETLSITPEAVSFRHVEGLRQFILSGHHGRRCGLPGQMLAEHNRATVQLWNASKTSLLPGALSLPVPGKVDIVALNIRLTAEIVDKPRSLSEMLPPYKVFLDLDRMGCSLQVRFRQSGDRFYPLGAPGVKKLQDFFIDTRIPRAERPYVPLVVSNGEIAWIVGYRIAESFKLRPETKRVLCLQYCALHEVHSG